MESKMIIGFGSANISPDGTIDTNGGKVISIQADVDPSPYTDLSESAPPAGLDPAMVALPFPESKAFSRKLQFNCCPCTNRRERRKAQRLCKRFLKLMNENNIKKDKKK